MVVLKLAERAKRLKTDVPAVFLCLKRKDLPWSARVLAFVTMAYALSPIDLVPDFIPVLGYLDDLIILPLLIALTVKAIPGNIFKECRAQAEGMWQNGKPKVWYYAIPIVIIWAAVIFLITRAILA